MVCDVDIKQYGPCTLENHYNYHKSAPCIFLKLNKIYGWVPEFYNESSSLPSNMPTDLKDYIKEKEQKELHTVRPISRSVESFHLCTDTGFIPDEHCVGFVRG